MNKKIHRKSMKKRILSALLTVVMVISMIPVSAFAADGSVAEVTIGNTTTQYSDLLSAFNAAQYASGSATVKLLDDFENFATGWSRTDGIQLSSGDVTLDLNGHYIDRYNNAAGTNANKKAVFYVTGSAKMTVMDSIGGGNIIQPLTEPSMIVDSGASLTVLSGTITNTGAGCGIRIDSGTLAIKGGMVNALYDMGICVGGGTVTVTGDSKIHSGKLNALLITGESSVTLSGGTYTTNGKNKSSILTQVGKVTDVLADGFRFTDANGLDVAITDDGQGTDSDNVIVSDYGIKYIDADGAEQKCTSFTELTDASDGRLNGWYVVTGNVNVEGVIGVTGGGTLNLILCDGATLNLQSILYLLDNATLNIYGQSGGTGTLNVKDTSGQPAIGVHTSIPNANVTVNIYGGTVTAQALYGAQPIGINPLSSKATVNVTIATGLKCVKTDDQNTAYAYDNTDDTSITITKCTDHKWLYSNITGSTHDQTCDLCGTAEAGVTHTTASYKYRSAGDTVHHLICACGKDYGREYHTYTYTPNSDGLTHTATCVCGYAVNDIEHTYKGENKICICGAIHSATYDGKNYASLQSAIDAAATVGGTVTLVRDKIDENVVVTDGTVTINMGGNRWGGNIDDGESFVPLTVNGGSVTLKNGNLFQWWSGSSARIAIVINGGSVTVEGDARVMGGVPDRNTKCPSITLNGGSLILKEGAALLTGLQVPDGKGLADYLSEGTTFVKGSYDYGSNTVTVSDPQEFIPDIYTENKITEGMVIVSHTHDFSTGACACGFDCDHSKVDEATGKCENCNTQIYVAKLTKADGTKQEYKSFSDAWSAAIATESSTLKLLCDIDLDNGNCFSAESGKFTFDLNGKTLSGPVSGELFSFGGTADITIKNGNMFNTINPANMQGDLSPSEGVAIALNGGTLTLDSVTLKGGTPRWGYGSEICWSVSVSGGRLVTDNSTFTGAVSIVILNGEANPEIKIISANLNNGLSYGFIGDKYAPDVVKSFFAEGSMLFDKDGKYIDVGDESYWLTEGDEENTFTGFIYSKESVVKPHTHTFVDGKCSECDYACPHDSGKNDREASYFEKAICSICHSEYGDFAPDTTAPTGEIKIKERTWWQSLLNTISFGLFYKEEVQVEITADDDSYKQAGYDESKHAVKMEYFISDTALSESEVKGSEFTEYTGAIDLSKDDQYVIYAKLTDHAGNVAYASTDGFEIDTTAPVIEDMVDGGRYTFCGEKTITIIDKNIDKVTLDGSNITPDENGQFVLPVDSKEHKIFVTDKAENETTVYVAVYPSHDFDPETDICRNCGTPAVAKVENGDISDRFASGDELLMALQDEKYSGATVTMLTDATVNVRAHLKYDMTIDLNGKTLKTDSNVGLTIDSGAVKILSSNGEGACSIAMALNGADASLTMGEGLGDVKAIVIVKGNLTINSGRYGMINSMYLLEDEAEHICLYGGSFKSIYLKSAFCSQILGKGYRFDGVTFSDAQKTELLTVSVVPCVHENVDSDNICAGCGTQFYLAVEANGTTELFDTVDGGIRYAEQNSGCTVKVLADISGNVAVKSGTFTLDATNTLINGKITVAKGADLTVSGGVITGNVICAKGGKLTASNTYFAGAINCVGEGEFRNCNLAGTVAGKGGLKLYSCEIPGNLSISGNAEAEECIVSGTVTVNNGGSFKSTGDTYRNTINVKSGGTLEMISGICDKKLTAESGSKLIISGGSYTEVEAGNNVDFTINDGKFTKITVVGKLIDCLAEGKAFEDMNNGFIIDGRVGIAGDVKVVDHAHTCVWNTTTHEKLCGCGYVEVFDDEAPVSSGIIPNGAYYGPTEFTVTDANDFTVTLDGKPITLENGKYTVEPDNGWHAVTATDVAGNSISFSFGVYKIYNVTLPTGAGYTVKPSDGVSTVKYGENYDFEVKIALGYSKTKNYKVLVNGKEPDSAIDSVYGGSYSVCNVSEDLVITVEGVADITPPKAEINIYGHIFKDFINRITFNLFYKKTQTVGVTGYDQGSGVSKVEYLLSETAFTDQDAITGNWTELKFAKDDEFYQAAFNIESNQKAYVYVRATDASGNITVVNSDGVVVYTDSEAITESVNFTRLDKNDVNFAVNLNGNTVKALYNGETVIDNSNYTVSEDGTITLKNSYVSTLAAGEYTIHVEYNPLGESYTIGEKPVRTSVKLNVEKRMPIFDLVQKTERTYSGEPIDISKVKATVTTDGVLVWEYKAADADDTAYSTTAPKNVGTYTLRVTAAETKNYKAGSATTTFEITPKEVLISDVAVENRVYDGTTIAKITSAGTMNGVVDGDDVAIVAGKANFNDKNVGTDKIVTFADFKLSGDDVANYKLIAQPESITASISAKELTITGLKVKDKQYDGKNTAEIDGTPALDGVVDGDDITLVNGIPTFDSVTTGENIPISFTEFTLSGDSTTVENYTLTQPSGITANIVAYVADGSEYDVNSNDWINSDFTITAKEGYKLSLTDTADGEWTDTLTASDETDSGKLTFYVKNTATGVISTAVTENYRIDKTAPTGEIRINERTTFRDFLNKITFGLFFKRTQTVGVTAQDTGSGLAKVEYLLSEKAFEDKDAVAGDWMELTLMGGKASFAIEPNKKAYIYLRMMDVSGNVQIINSEGVVVYTDSEAITETVNFTMRDKDDVNFKVKLNGNTVKALYNGETVIDDSNYTVSEDGTITLKNSYISTLAAGEYTIRVAYDPMGESYVAGDEPAMTSVKLTVEKRMPTFSIAQRTERAYDGNPISVDSVVTTNGDLVWEYKPVDADDTAYTKTAPKNVGIYTVRLTAIETDVYKEASVTTIFEITPKELTITGLKVKDKQYDGTNSAEFDGTPVLNGVVDGDDVTLVNGIPTFDSVTTAENIPISFTEFTLAGDSTTVGNYALTQPSGITANIMAYVADGSEYEVNSNDWINNDFVITAKEGYKLSLTDTVDGEWTDTLTVSDETSDGELIFYVKNTAIGVISTAITENYKIDRTMPTGEIKVNENTTFRDFMNDITLGLFFKKTLIVDVTAQDAGSGLAKAEYLLSEKAFEDKDAVDGDWAELTLTDGKASFAIEPNKKAYIYLRMKDVSGNVQVINSEGVVVYTDSEAITENVNFTMLDDNDVNFEVKLNGNTVKALYNGETVIDSSNYTVSENGIITLKNSYVSTLAAGEYTIRVAYNPLGESYTAGDEPLMTSVKLIVEKQQYNGTDKAEINDKDDKSTLGEGVDGSNKHSASKNAETGNTPKTGDTSNFALWIALLFISGGIGTGTAVFRRKKKFLKK